MWLYTADVQCIYFYKSKDKVDPEVKKEFKLEGEKGYENMLCIHKWMM